MSDESDLTQDGIFSRALTLWQPARGYRFGVDSLLLALFARPHAANARVLDLGAGVGVVSMALAFPVPAQAPARQLVAVELQPRLAALAQRNATENQLPIVVVQRDLKCLPDEASGRGFDLVVSNPPYFAVGDGQRTADPERDIARSEVSATIADVFAAASRCLSGKGKLALVYPAPQLPRLLRAASRSALQLIALRPVYAREGEEATLSLLLFKMPSGKGLPPLSMLPPWVLADAGNQPNPEIERWLQRGY